MQALNLQDLDRQRARWETARARFRMHDRNDTGFASGLLAMPVSGFCARMVILPADPEADNVEFNADFWEFWKQPVSHPGGGEFRWGNDARPSAYGAVLFKRYLDTDCSYYAACLRSGGIEIALGRSYASLSDSGGVLFLGPVVGALWAACISVDRIAKRYEVPGPWEISVAIPNSRTLTMARFANGWAEPADGWAEVPPSTCHHQHILLRTEVPRLTDGWAGTAAFRLGGQIEDAFGFDGRRFVACQGEHKGQLEPRHRQLP